MDLAIELEIAAAKAGRLEEFAKQHGIGNYELHLVSFVLGHLVGSIGADNTRAFVAELLELLAATSGTVSVDGQAVGHKAADPPKPPPA